MLGRIIAPVAGVGMKLLEEGGGTTDPTPSFTLSSLLTDIGSVFSEMMDWVGTLMSTITGNPLLLLLVVGSFALIAIGIVRRLLRL